jgi:hypothetical protein
MHTSDWPLISSFLPCNLLNIIVFHMQYNTQRSTIFSLKEGRLFGIIFKGVHRVN